MQLNRTKWDNIFFVAAAGSGKTTFLVEEALKIQDENVLITTYTEANNEEIKLKILEIKQHIPQNIKVQTWFSTLLQHGVRPYQATVYDSEIRGMNLVPGQSAQYIAETNVEKHYFDSNNKLYSDKVSKFVLKCNEKSNGKLISRLKNVFPYIFVDESQDLAGHDLDVIKLFAGSNIKLILVGDPRQGTFSTNNSGKNKKFRRFNILEYFKNPSEINIKVDDQSLKTNRRSIQDICSLSDKLFPEFEKVLSGNSTTTGHDGIFLVQEKDIEKYLTKYAPTQLRDSKRVSVNETFSVMNFGASKGLTFDRVLIYPTKPIIDWLRNNESDLAPMSRSKLYVAITRARFSVAFVYDYNKHGAIDGCIKYDFGAKNE